MLKGNFKRVSFTQMVNYLIVNLVRSVLSKKIIDLTLQITISKNIIQTGDMSKTCI